MLAFVFIGIMMISLFGCSSESRPMRRMGMHGDQMMPPGNFTPRGMMPPGNFTHPGNFSRPMNDEMMQQFAAACDGKSEGDACSIETPRGTMDAVCVSDRDTLMCRPEGPREAMHP